MPNWFVYDKNGVKRGPISSAQLKKLADAQKISRETIIENEAGRQAKAGRIKGLFAVSVINPQSPPVNMTATEQSPPVQQAKPLNLPDDRVLTNENSLMKVSTSREAENKSKKILLPWKTVIYFFINYLGYFWLVFFILSLPVAFGIAVSEDSDSAIRYSAVRYIVLSCCITPFVLLIWSILKRVVIEKFFLSEYQKSLDKLITNPNDPQLRRIALEKGRKLIKRHLLSETSLTQDIDAACAGATIGEGNAHKIKIKTSSSTVAQEIDELLRLCKSGIISSEEFEIGKNNILGNDKIDSKARELKMLHELKERGTLSQSEFSMKKWEILSRK